MRKRKQQKTKKKELKVFRTLLAYKPLSLCSVVAATPVQNGSFAVFCQAGTARRVVSSFICQVASARRQRSDLCGLRVKLFSLLYNHPKVEAIRLIALPKE